MVDYLSIIHEYFPPGSQREHIYLVHAAMVTKKALDLGRRLKLSGKQLSLIESGAMLHDIGIVDVDAPGLDCHGTHPYIFHGVAGSEILRRRALEAEAKIAERHVGVGLSARYIRERDLPLPAGNYVPQTLPEKLVTYADCFYSKNPEHLWEEDTVGAVVAQLNHFNPADVITFMDWVKKFEPERANE